ncbi:MAG: ABC transporter ATP-binding protein, partial [bacterium]|nr:ABC transporter ATP-binding protein [bacterium]
GEFVALMGPSGSGKSTLMNIVGFLDHLTSGEYHFEDHNASNLDSDQLANLRSNHVGFIFQTFNLLSNTSVIDNVILPMVYSDIPVRERYARAIKAIESVKLDHRIDFLSNQLSGGERQRVAIARALVNDPKLILADEPTGNLDTKSGAAVLEILQNLHESGRTIVMVTHESEAAEYADRIVHMRDGFIQKDSNNHTRRRGSYNK